MRLIVFGLNHPDFLGEIIAELEPLRASDAMRGIDALAMHQRHTMETGGAKAAK